MCVCMCYVSKYMTMFVHTCTVHGCMHEEFREQPWVLFFWCSMLYAQCTLGFFFFEVASVTGLELCKQTELAWQICLASSALGLQVCSSTFHDFA